MSTFDYLDQSSRKGRLHSRPPEKDNEIACFIRQARTANGWDQKALAQRAEVGLRALKEIEQGKLNAQIRTILKILEVFGHTLGPKPKEIAAEDRR